MSSFLPLLAACFYATGAVFMKQSDCFSRMWPTTLLFVCFVIGAAVQTKSMRHAEMSTNAMVVIALEAVLAFGFGFLFFREAISLPKMSGVALVVAGVYLLRTQ